jgi:hypothetical protein
MRQFAKRLIVCEANGNLPAKPKAQDAFHVCEKLHPQLATLIGECGFLSLLSRALALASAERPWLRPVHLKSDGAWDGLTELEAQLNPDELFDGGVVVVAQLLGLLVAFIGENLTLRLVREVWPNKLLNEREALQ